jgi:hypothetical protein
MSRSKVQKNMANPMTEQDALNWCLMAWMETKTRGYYVASGFKNIRSKDMFNVAAVRSKLCEKKLVSNIMRCVWVDTSWQPNNKDAKKLFAAYKAYQKETIEAAKAKKAKARQVVKAKKQPDSTTVDSIIKAAKQPGKKEAFFNDGGMWHKGFHVEDRLVRIEGKLNRLLNIWDDSSCKSKSKA